MYLSDKQLLAMHNSKKIDKIYQLSKTYLCDFIVDGTINFQFYLNLPKMNDCEIVSLALFEETLSNDSKNSF